MTLDDLALPFWIEQIGVTFRCVLWLDQRSVVTDHRKPGAHGRAGAIRIYPIARQILCHILGHIGRDPVLALPEDEVCGVGAAYEIDRIDAAVLLLLDPLKDSFSPGTLNPRGNPRIPCLESSGQFLGDIQFERTVKRNLALLACGPDQGRGQWLSLRHSRLGRLRENRTSDTGG